MRKRVGSYLDTERVADMAILEYLEEQKRIFGHSDSETIKKALLTIALEERLNNRRSTNDKTI